MIFLDKDDIQQNNVGSKAYQLHRLKDVGFRVPNFLCIGFQQINIVDSKNEWTDEERSRIQNEIGDGPFAVRSASDIEDQAGHSMAGQFMTLLPVAFDGLLDAIKKVSASNRERAPNARHALIVQHCLLPDVAGVVFTRSPIDPFCIQCDQVKGFGEMLVAGKQTPDTSFYPRRYQPALTGVDKRLCQLALSVERFFGMPQDIEWCVVNHEAYLLQSRPITTINVEQERFFQKIEETLPRHAYDYVQDGYAELAPHADAFMLELLRGLFQKDGPVEHAYKRFGIKGTVTSPLRVIGQTVFVDTAIERTLFQRGLRGWLNQARLQRAKLQAKPFINELRNKMHSTQAPLVTTLDEMLHWIYQEYESVFAANLLSTSLLEDAKFAKKRWPHLKPHELIDAEDVIAAPMHVIGNVFSLSDTSVFLPRQFLVRPKNNQQSLRLEDRYLSAAIYADAIREYGRWYAVMLMNALREWLKQYQPDVLTTRQAKPQYGLPRRLSTAMFRPSESLYLSAGKAKGIIVMLEQIDTVQDPILFTHELTPDLASYLPKLRGIITSVGGTLSHMAIVAREYHIPILRLPMIDADWVGKEITLDSEAKDLFLL